MLQGIGLALDNGHTRRRCAGGRISVPDKISNKDVQHIDFDDDGLRAVDDLRSRCAYWLDLEPYRTAKELPDCFPECDWEDLRGADFSRGELFGGKLRPPTWLVLISQGRQA